jgi:hypothetical protein
MAALAEMARPLAEVGSDELWREELGVELVQLKGLQQQILIVHAKLDELAAVDPRVALLRTIPGVGPRLSEAIVTMFDDMLPDCRPGRVLHWHGAQIFRLRRDGVRVASRGMAIGWCVRFWWRLPGLLCGTTPGHVKPSNASVAAKNRDARLPSLPSAENC